jgi:chemotaxis response regulator CheB
VSEQYSNLSADPVQAVSGFDDGERVLLLWSSVRIVRAWKSNARKLRDQFLSSGAIPNSKSARFIFAKLSSDSVVSFKRSKIAMSVPIVGIGASAGGLESFFELIADIPASTGMAYVFVQHLDPVHKPFSDNSLQKSGVARRRSSGRRENPS